MHCLLEMWRKIQEFMEITLCHFIEANGLWLCLSGFKSGLHIIIWLFWPPQYWLRSVCGLSEWLSWDRLLTWLKRSQSAKWPISCLLVYLLLTLAITWLISWHTVRSLHPPDPHLHDQPAADWKYLGKCYLSKIWTDISSWDSPNNGQTTIFLAFTLF